MDERIYQDENELWHYKTRGNHAVGPFDSQLLAQQALQKQIQSWSGRSLPRAAWPRHLQPSRIFRRSATRHS